MNGLSWCKADAPPILAALDRLPKVSWPTRERVPCGWDVECYERPHAVTVVVTISADSAAARMDLETREVAVSSSGPRLNMRVLARHQVMRLVADRSRYEDRRHRSVERIEAYALENPDTWTSMQMFAAVTGGYWYPPLPRDDDVGTLRSFQQRATAFNRVLRRERLASAKVRRQVQSRGERSSRGLATPDQSAPAGE